MQERSWYRLIADANKARLPNTETPFEVIRKHVDEFKPLLFAKYQKDSRKALISLVVQELCYSAVHFGDLAARMS